MELVAASGVRLRVGFVVAVVDFSHLGTKNQHQMALVCNPWGGKKRFHVKVSVYFMS